MKHLTLLFLFLFIPTLFITGCSESGNITETGQSQIDLTPIDPTKIVDIPDENLAKLIREALELPDDVDDITAGQLATLEELWCRGSGPITDWTGLEYATQLEALHLTWCLWSENPITGERESIWNWDKESADLTPLVGLKNLHLYLGENGIRDITPLKVLKNLKGLYLTAKTEDLTPLAELKQLTKLSFNPGWGVAPRNDLAPLAGLKQLTSLTFIGFFDDITPVAGLKQLTRLHLDGNFDDITPLSGLKQLISLSLDGNFDDITPLSGLKQLTYLNLSDLYDQFDNDISDVTPLSGLINLETLDLRGNPIVDKTPLDELRKKNPNVVIHID